MTASLKFDREYIQSVAPEVRKVAEDLCKVMDKCIEVAQKFDGKVINKRFTDALQECSPLEKNCDGYTYPRYHFSLSQPYTVTGDNKWSSLTIYFQRSVQFGGRNQNFGGSRCVYLRDLIPTEVYFVEDGQTSLNTSNMGERMDAEKFRLAVVAFQCRLRNTAKNYEDMQKNYSKYEKACQKAQEAVNKYFSMIPATLRPQGAEMDFSILSQGWKVERQAERDEVIAKFNK